MDQQENAPETKRGALGKTFDWTVMICLCVTLVGLTWKYIVKPLFLG
jgi:hypothetical protein